MAGGTPEDRRFAGTVDRLGVAALLLLVSRVLADPLLVNHDCGALLFAGGWLLEGKRPFLDYYLLNPPLIDYLQVVPTLLSRVARIPVPFAFNLIVLATVGLSWWLIRRLLRGSGLVTASTAAAVALAPLLVSHTTYTQLWANFDFGQREHFFILLALPYVVLRWLRWEDRPVPLALALAVGFGAGLFGSLKPHFLAVLLAPEAVWLARHRQPRRLLTGETIAAAAFVLLYAAHFAFLPGPMREAFFHRWVPMIWSGYGAYDAPLGSLLSDHRLVLALATATLAPPAAPSRAVGRVAARRAAVGHDHRRCARVPGAAQGLVLPRDSGHGGRDGPRPPRAGGHRGGWKAASRGCSGALARVGSPGPVPGPLSRRRIFARRRRRTAPARVPVSPGHRGDVGSR